MEDPQIVVEPPREVPTAMLDTPETSTKLQRPSGKATETVMKMLERYLTWVRDPERRAAKARSAASTTVTQTTRRRRDRS